MLKIPFWRLPNFARYGAALTTDGPNVNHAGGANRLDDRTVDGPWIKLDVVYKPPVVGGKDGKLDRLRLGRADIKEVPGDYALIVRGDGSRRVEKDWPI
jgi:hypothetical protein